jgi:hypothetical protein
LSPKPSKSAAAPTALTRSRSSIRSTQPASPSLARYQKSALRPLSPLIGRLSTIASPAQFCLRPSLQPARAILRSQPSVVFGPLQPTSATTARCRRHVGPACHPPPAPSSNRTRACRRVHLGYASLGVAHMPRGVPVPI